MRKIMFLTCSIILCFILFIIYILTNHEKSLSIFELPDLNLKENHINQITFITQMTETYPMYLVAESQEQVDMILAELKKLGFTPVQIDEVEKGWAFMFRFHMEDDKQINLSLDKTMATSNNYSYDIMGYDASAFIELFHKIDSEKLRYP